MCLWFRSDSYSALWYGKTGMSWPSFCGRPITCQKQQCPLVRRSCCLSCSLSNIQKGLSSSF
jgi:hypothetical protein